MKVAVASDHAGLPLKDLLKADLLAMGHEVSDLGTHDTASVDYPDFGYAAAETVAQGKAERAVICCGTGIGISIAANRNAGVRAALCHDVTTARLAREHNDANVLALGARVMGTEAARDCLKAFMETAFAAGRHAPRVDKLGRQG